MAMFRKVSFHREDKFEVAPLMEKRHRIVAACIYKTPSRTLRLLTRFNTGSPFATTPLVGIDQRWPSGKIHVATPPLHYRKCAPHT